MKTLRDIENGMQRSFGRWDKAEPSRMAMQSPAALAFAFEDAIRDIRHLRREIEKLLEETKNDSSAT